VLFGALFSILPFGQSSILIYLSSSKWILVSLAVAVLTEEVPIYHKIKIHRYYWLTSVFT